jgi:hypothetical protein
VPHFAEAFPVFDLGGTITGGDLSASAEKFLDLRVDLVAHTVFFAKAGLGSQTSHHVRLSWSVFAQHADGILRGDDDQVKFL